MYYRTCCSWSAFPCVHSISYRVTPAATVTHTMASTANVIKCSCTRQTKSQIMYIFYTTNCHRCMLTDSITNCNVAVSRCCWCCTTWPHQHGERFFLVTIERHCCRVWPSPSEYGTEYGPFYVHQLDDVVVCGAHLVVVRPSIWFQPTTRLIS